MVQKVKAALSRTQKSRPQPSPGVPEWAILLASSAQASLSRSLRPRDSPLPATPVREIRTPTPFASGPGLLTRKPSPHEDLLPLGALSKVSNHSLFHSGYEVQAYRHRQDSDPESGDPEGDPLYIWAPNSGNTGHGYICAHDDECGSEGDQWWGRKSEGDALWDAEENKGGPQDYVWGTDPENRWN